jgi:ribosome biogenesis GTPase
MMEGRIIKALSGFYYVDVGESQPVTCRARGKFRHQKVAPLVGDLVEITCTEPGAGMVDRILPRQNEFTRPAVANIDQLVIIASGAIPVTDPFLIDRMTTIAQAKGCSSVICFNKCDLNRADDLASIYERAGFVTLQVSAETGEGITELRDTIAGKVSAFTGNSGVGKSSILNSLYPDFALPVGEVSEKLGRGRHTTRHVELFGKNGTYVVDTPGFSSFDVERMELIRKEALAENFLEFRPYLEQCKFIGCSHTKEKGCAVLHAVMQGEIAPSRHQSYLRLYEQAKEIKDWQL